MLENKLTRYSNWNTKLFFQGNANEDVICNMSAILFRSKWVNSLAPGRFQFNFRKVFCKLILENAGWGISYKIALRWTSLDLTDDKSTLVQVMAWCRQAPSHYLSQCWPRSLSSYGITRPQWVKRATMLVKKSVFFTMSKDNTYRPFLMVPHQQAEIFPVSCPVERSHTLMAHGLLYWSEKNPA